MNGWSDFQSFFQNVPHLILNTFYQPNKPKNGTKIVDRVYLEWGTFLKRLKIGPTIQEILVGLLISGLFGNTQKIQCSQLYWTHLYPLQEENFTIRPPIFEKTIGRSGDEQIFGHCS